MTVTYRNKFQNYYQDKGGQHQPPGSILPVLVDVNSGAGNEIEEYSHQGYLYCDGRELNIRDYPILYKSIRNTYGGNTVYSPQQASSPGGLRRLFWINDKAFLNFYRDPSVASTLKMPYPFGASVRFVGQTNTFTGNISTGSPDITAIPSTDINDMNVGDVVELMGNNGTVTLPVNTTVLSKDAANFTISLSNSFGGSGTQISAQFGVGVGFGSIGPGVFAFNNYYQTKQPTEDVSAQVGFSEYAYEIVFPDPSLPNGVDPSTLPQFTVDFTSGGAVHPNLNMFKSFNTRDMPRSIGTFFLPDYRERIVVGYGSVDGLGSATVEDALNNTVGQVGGSWYIAQNQLLNGGIFFDIGNVKTTGYSAIQADISTFISGNVSTTVGPINDHIFSRPIEHYHNILSSEPDESLAVEFGGSPSDKFGVIYSKSRSNVIPFEPSVSGGVALGHSHGLSATMLNDGNMATYGNAEGIGLDDGGTPKKWNVTSAPSINITSITYDAPNDKCIVATAEPHGYSSGDWITIQGATPGEYNGSFLVLGSGLSTQGFEYDPTSDSQPNAPGTSPAGGNPLVKLASGTFDEVTSIPQPRFYAINNQTIVGGKATVIVNPGTGVTFQQDEALTPSTITMNPVPASSGEVTQIDITLMAPGGGGADSDNNGGDAGYAYATFTVDGTSYTITANGGDGGTAGSVGGQNVLQTRDWLEVGNTSGGSQNISSGAAAVWSTFLLNNGIYPVVPLPSQTDPNLGNWVEGGVGIEVDASLAAAGFNVEFHADGSSELDLYNPNGTWKQGNATPPNTTGPGVPYTSQQTLVVPANTLTVGWNQLTFRVKNDASASNTWDQNPGGIGFVATRNDNGSTMFTSRGDCTGGITTTSVPGTGGGAGGSGGSFSYPPSLDSEDWFAISTNTTGLSGDTGGTQGTDQSETNGGGDTGTTPKPLGSGGDGGANGFSAVISLGTQSFTAFNDTWNNPPQLAGETSRNIILTVSGAGGGNGNPNANSGCEAGSTNPPGSAGNPSDGSAIGGAGTNGAVITATLGSVPNTITMQIGRAGGTGENARDGYAQGTGSETGGAASGGNGPAVGGISGVGAWGNGATGGAGGGATGVYFNGGNVFVGAGGGGGGGGSGGGYNGGGTTDGCYAGGDSTGAGTNLHSMTTAMDFVNGADGTSGGCTAGGGGGGGGGCGPSGAANGGEGGTAGVGHNGNGGGSGGQRGDSAYRSDMCIATWSGNGSPPGSDGYVSIFTSVNATQYGFNGGGGGQGAVAIVSIIGKNIAITAGLQSPGNGGGEGEDGANGYIQVRYAGSEGGGTTPGNPSVPQGKYYLCDPAGIPSGSAFDADIWQTSTNDDMEQIVPGPGSTASDKFAINAGAGAPSYGGLVTKYLPWIGDSSANNLREYYVGPFNLTNVNNMRFTVIRGNGSNGGAIPEEDLMVYWKTGSSNTTTLLNTIVPASTTANDWDFYNISLPEANNIRQNDVYLYLRQNRTAGQDDNDTETEDNYGLAGIHLFYDEETNQVFTPASGSLIGGIDVIDTTITPTDASMLAGDGKFTMSSSTPITTSVVASPESNIPLITRYHRVKYLIKAI